MQENELIVEIIKILSGSPSLLVSVAFGALLLKKYIINGNTEKYFALKAREVDSLDALKQALSQVIQWQEKLYELHEKNSKGA